MKKKILLATFITFLFSSITINAGDPPHNSASDVDCSDCHGQTLLNSQSPFWTDNTDDSAYSALCLRCHTLGNVDPYNATNAPPVKSHESIKCTTCHHNHDQDQIYNGKNNRGYFFLAKGTATSAVYSSGSDTTTITYSSLEATDSNSDWADDLSLLTEKTNEGRGTLLIPNTGSRKRWPLFMIVAIDDPDDNTIRVKGNVSAVSKIAIMYGQLIRRHVKYDPVHTTSRSVILFDKEGIYSLAHNDEAVDVDPPDGTLDDSTPTGICQVCHTNTNHWRNDGTKSENHYSGQYCIRCHPHTGNFLHGGGAGGSGCIECHGHDDGTLYDPDMSAPYTPGTEASIGAGTFQSHSTHTETDTDDLKGPGIYCDTCHDINNFPYFKSGSDGNGDSLIELSETDVCDSCHSGGGTYDGLNDPVIGAKQIWSTGAYVATNDSTLLSNKEKWCATCHDENGSQIQGITAPNIIGDEDGSYTYGTGWGYYKTGHGVAAGDAYPYKGGLIEPPLVNSAAKPVECNGCHDYSTAHIDGLARTFDDGGSALTDSSVYRQGYRLKLVGGNEPMHIPWKGPGSPVSPPNNADRYRLCAGCHDDEPFINTGITKTNLVTGGVNRHNYHMEDANLRYAADWDAGYDGAGATSRMTCVACHNVHGSTRLAMVRDGALTDRAPGLKIWYYNDDTLVHSTSNPDPPYPENTPLAASDGTVWRGDTSGNLCNHCHHNNNTEVKPRTPYQDVSQSPILDWTGENGYITDGVDPDSATAKNSFTFRIKYTDKNNDAPNPIQVWIDIDDSGSYDGGEEFTMVQSDLSDINYTDGKIYTYSLAISKDGDNTFDYRFYASDGALTVEFPTAPNPDKTVTVTNNPPTLTWTGETNYESFGVHPAIGKDGENFIFRITYSDADGEAPTLKQVWIDADESGSYDLGEKHDMTQVSGDFTNGMIYSYNETLSYVTDGTVDYTFRFNDGFANASDESGPLSDNIATVVNSTNNPPMLDWVVENCSTNGAKPIKGLASGDFTFKVRYTDIDNQCPPTASDIQVVVNGSAHNLTAGTGDCNTGRIYSTTLQLGAVGDLTYYFTASDGTDTASGDPAVASGKQVTVVDTANAVGVRTGTGDTAPWYNTIQSAVAATAANVTVLVYEGTYNENVTINDTPDDDDGIILESVCGADVTIINASAGNVVSVLDVDTSATIDGFTITGGSDGIYINKNNVTVKNSIISNNSRGISSYTNSELTLENTVIRDNTGDVSGAGILINGSSGHSITGSTIQDNTANYNALVPGSGNGGGILIQSGASGVTVTDTIISGNHSDLSGGGIYLNNSSMTLTRTIVSANTSDTTGGGLSLQGTGSSTLINCNIVDNIADTQGGGIYTNNHTFDTTNCTVSNNSLTDTTNGKGGGLYVNNPGLSINNTIFWDNEASGKGSGHEVFTNNGAITFSYSDVPDNLNALATSGSGSFSLDSTNIEAAPLFVDRANGDYHLKSISPVIDQGTATGAPADDIEGDSRPQGSGIDIGSDEYSTVGLETEPPVVSDFTATTPSTSLNVPIPLFTATDNIGVTGYIITTSAVPPTIGGAGWSGTPPSTYLVATDGTYTLYPWARDAAGNVSAVYGTPQTVNVDANAPTVTTFTATTPTNTLNIPITTFTATDTVGVTGYQITESSTPPSGSGGGWSGTAPTTYTVGSAGTYTLYPWAKDAFDNVSAVYGSPLTVVVDTTPPTVDSTVPSNSDTGVTPNNNVTINWDENIDCLTVTTSTVTISPQPGAWTLTICSGSQAVFSPDSQSQLTTYTVTVSTSVKDVAGNAMGSDYVFSYDTSGGTNTVPVLSWTTENCLIEGVKPRAGKPGYSYEFKINYTDDENQCPTSGSTDIQVWVDLDGDGYEGSEEHNLTEVSAGDNDCTNGKLYSTTLTLSSTGDLNFRFYASDGIDDATGSPTSDGSVGVYNATVVRPSGTGLPKDYTSIISAANAVSGYILVYPNDGYTAATYSENIALYNKDNRNIISACGADLTIISSPAAGSATITAQDSANLVVDGFSITGATSSYGVNVNRVDATTLTIRNSKVYGNSYGFYINDSDNIPVEIDNVEIYNNSTRGIQLVNSDDDANIMNSVIRSHNVSGNGAAIAMNNSNTVTISKSIIRDNTTSGQGGAIYINLGSLTITNSIITGNQALSGGAISTNSGPTVQIINSTVADNQATNGGVMYICSTGSTTIKNSIFWNNTASSGNGANIYKACGGGNIGTISYSDMTTSSPSIYNASFTNGGGNISPAQDPQFIDSGNDNYHICNGSGDPDAACGVTQSPAIDAGTSSGAPSDDIDGESRDVNPDMGADEYVAP